VAADPTGKVLKPDVLRRRPKMVMENLRLALADGGAAERKIGQLGDELKRCQSPQA
jgi:hypothetical protein